MSNNSDDDDNVPKKDRTVSKSLKKLKETMQVRENIEKNKIQMQK